MRYVNIPHNILTRKVDEIYAEMVKFRRNLFKLPSGKAGKDFVSELAYWLRQFNQRSKLNKIAIKFLMILPTLLLQKPSPKSKAKQHLISLQRRLELWKTGQLDDLIREARHIQSGFKKSNAPNNTPENLSKKFAKFISEGKILAALKLLDNTSSSGLLPLTEDVMTQLKEKHTEPAHIIGDQLLRGQIDKIPDCYFDCIDEQDVLKAAKDTKGAGGPSGLDADQYRRIICSKNSTRKERLFERS